jgi:hypothetical protein
MREEETPVQWIRKIVFDAVGFDDTQIHKELMMSFDLAVKFEKDHIMEAFDDGKKNKKIKTGADYYNSKFNEAI